MKSPKVQYCQTKGCSTSRIHGSKLCRAHEQKKKDAQKIAADAKKIKKSLCCNQACIKGEVHVYGFQYCVKCKEACLWKTVLA